ncbi:uncharacterized protein LOC127445028 [Myxocyprinus asiaticus]|uniref:uncharacterized protein LOC127445028 n=1 Tax=Myxocyprinus asiaticus TaxID=70543 RepID=UPI0022212FBA|nr:uncharacterized protein LOC127445028 [Myxocyprinus asiaticus]
MDEALAVHLCPQSAATWHGCPKLPSRACRFTSSLTARAYSAAGQAASTLHAMAVLQVHQAKGLKELQEGSSDPGLMQELRSATDLALRVTKITARTLGQVMSTLVVQERHLWLNLIEMREADKAWFLDAPISQVGLFGDTVEDFAQQFLAVKQQTEAIQHILPQCGSRPRTPSARFQGHPPAATTSALPQPAPVARPRCGAQRRKQTPPSHGRPPRTRGRLRSAPETGDPGARRPASPELVSRPFHPLVEGREENLLFCFHFISPHVQETAVPKNTTKEQFSCSLGHMFGVHGSRHDHRPPSHLCRYGAPAAVPPPLCAQLWHKHAHTGLGPVDYGDETPPPSSANFMVGGRSQVSALMSLNSARPRGSNSLDMAPRAPPRGSTHRYVRRVHSLGPPHPEFGRRGG